MTDLPKGLRYVSDDEFTWQRKRHGKGFVFLDADNRPLTPPQTEAIKQLVIPPAWTHVKICANSRGHIQAVGIDAKNRKQYIYHPVWTAHKQEQKFEKIVRFGEVLPVLRETMAGHMRQHTLSRERVLATVVWLLEHTFIRVGNKLYERENQSYGLTTLREKHVEVEGNRIRFSFKGKSGIFHELDITHPRVASTIKKCIELPGYELFQYLTADQQRERIDSGDVNEYMKRITGEDLSAKDFRTWGGTTLAGDLFYQKGSPESATAAKDGVCEVVKEVAAHLRNTTPVCRKYYIHPAIVNSYEHDRLVPHFTPIYARNESPVAGLKIEEYATWSLLDALT